MVHPKTVTHTLGHQKGVPVSDEPTVLIVGAGPTGLMLACELAAAGVSCRIVERRTEESNLTRAFGVHARTLEMLDMRGLADRLVDRGLRVSQVRPRPSRRTTLRLLLDHPESRFRYVLIVAQAQTEKLLEQRATELGVPISRGAELVGLHQDEAGVELVLSTADGTVTERARYAVGCDGAHSAVRRLLGVGFTGSAYDTNILLADVRLGASLETAVNVFVSKDGLVLLPTFGDGWYRAVIWDRRQEEVPLDTPLHLEEIIEPLRRITGRDFGVREMRWSTRFLTERRQADRYRVGRVLLAGDAAHVHSPLGALGMNTGIQDAMNLGWKLAAEVAGWAPGWLLDSYHTERHPVGRANLRLTDALQRLAVAPAPVRAVRPFIARVVFGLPPLRRRLRRTLSGLSVGYPPPRGARVHRWTGKRAPDADLADGRLYQLLRPGRFLLLDRTREGAAARATREGWADRVDTVHDPAAVLTGWPALVLIRPDGYVAAAADSQEAASRAPESALRQWCGSSAPSVTGPTGEG